MTSLQQALARLQQYSSKLQSQGEVDLTTPAAEEDYADRLSRSLQSLQLHLNEHRATLEKLRAQNDHPISIEKPDEEKASRIRQLQTITAAYKSNTLADPTLPSADSPLPALLALRSTLRTIDETKIALRECRDQITDAHSNYRRQEADLQDARQMTAALEERREKLRFEQAEIERDGPGGTITTILQTHQRKSSRYADELRRLVVAFNKFIDEHLAVMIAAEQLGGPVAGDDLLIDDAMLKAGFDKQGKPRKMKAAKNQSHSEEQMDIDDSEADGTVAGAARRAAAAAGMRRIAEELLNALADDENPESYVIISKETAAVRFLIRAKVAQFHPADSRKLRLMDFGTEAVDSC